MIEKTLLFSESELMQVAKTLHNKKATGPDGLPTEVLMAVAQTNPEVLLDM